MRSVGDAVHEVLPVAAGAPTPFLDAEATPGGALVAAWRTLRQPTRVSRRGADGVWSTPREIDGAGHVLIRRTGGRMLVLVVAGGLTVHASDDDGSTWRTREHAPTLVAHAADATVLPDGRVVLAVAGVTLAHGACWWAPPASFPDLPRLRRDPLLLLVLHSDDGGETWTEPRTVATLGTLRPDRGLAMIRDRGVRLSPVTHADGSTRLYVSVARMTGPGAGNQIACSADGGDSWSPLVPLAIDGAERLVGSGHHAATVLARGSGVGLVLRHSGTLRRAVADASAGAPPGVWTDAGAVDSDTGPSTATAHALARADGSAEIVWGDARRARRRWWSRSLVLSALHGWSGVWPQSDLFASTWRADGPATDARPLTPRGARVWATGRLIGWGERVALLWRGALRAPDRHGRDPQHVYLTHYLPA